MEEDNIQGHGKRKGGMNSSLSCSSFHLLDQECGLNVTLAWRGKSFGTFFRIPPLAFLPFPAFLPSIHLRVFWDITFSEKVDSFTQQYFARNCCCPILMRGH